MSKFVKRNWCGSGNARSVDHRHLTVTPVVALQAVEALTEIVRDSLMQGSWRIPHVEALNALRMGCEAIRMGRPDSMFAMNILARKTPQKPRRVRGRVGVKPIGKARNGGKKS